MAVTNKKCKKKSTSNAQKKQTSNAQKKSTSNVQKKSTNNVQKKSTNNGIGQRPKIKQVKRQQLADRDDKEVRELRKKIEECKNLQQIMDLLGDKVQDLNIICSATAIYNISNSPINTLLTQNQYYQLHYQPTLSFG
eukprot:TRINITY_DN19886_c0_g1_i2.p3 TRINITY_DN19886_c0_g1~~TRINITY_DN19886_c0_g1_i2.p3  ORF type:complete len:137 (-),score=7.10 TRINITY_DN19886_c0_g1_i2:3-413(-)